MIWKKQIIGSTTHKGENQAAFWGLRFTLLILLIWLLSFIVGFQQSLLLLGGLGLIGVILGVSHPVIGLLGIAMLCALDPMLRVFTFAFIGLSWNSLNYLLLAVMLLSLPFLLRLNDAHSRLLEVFIVVLAMGLVISQNILFGVQHILNIFITFGLVIYFARNAQNTKAWYWTGIVTGTMTAIGSLVFFLQRNDIAYIDPNAWIFFPITGLFSLALGVSYTEKNRDVWLVGLLASLNFTSTFLSGSRSGTLMAAASLLFIVFKIKTFSQRATMVVAGVILMIAFTSYFTEMQANTLHRFKVLTDNEYLLATRTSGRSDLLLASWNIFLRNPILGVGTGGFTSASDDIGEQINSRVIRSGNVQSHSAWGKTLAENGAIGFMFLLCYVLSFVIVGLRSNSKDLALSGLLTATILSIAFISTEFRGKGLWLLTAGTTVMLHRQQIVSHWQDAKQRKPFFIRHYRK